MEIGENKIETFGIENLSVIKNNYNLELTVEINGVLQDPDTYEMMFRREA